MEIGMISVDKWSSGSQAYFLTHLHADHTAGLSSTWNRGPIFCSRITAKLFNCKFHKFDLSLLRVLEIGYWHSIKLITPSSGDAATVSVKAIDAQHCPGAVMYLFRGEFGCMLYTGDFRWEKTSNAADNGRTMLRNALKNEKLDIMYLDNTYCNPRYSFPSREVAAKQVVDIITSHSNHDIIIGIDSLGKEDLLLYISRTLNIKIWVWPERLQIMHLLGYHENFTTKTSLTRVRAVPRYSFSIDTLEGLNTLRPTIGIMPSGLPWATKFKKQNNIFGSSPSTPSHNTNIDIGGSVQRYHEYIYVVPYSDHSCFVEIQELIELLRPINIKGIVSSSSSSYIDPRYYFGHLCGTKQAFWRVNKKLENEEGNDEVGKIESEVHEVASSVNVGRKRFDFLGVHVSRVKFLRRLSRGVRIADSETIA